MFSLGQVCKQHLETANNQRPTAKDWFQDRAHHDPYISLLQPFGVESTIQNFDADDGNFNTRHRSSVRAKNGPTRLNDSQFLRERQSQFTRSRGFSIAQI
jgi:hypothetical protein